jgi:hypothetical protein
MEEMAMTTRRERRNRHRDRSSSSDHRRPLYSFPPSSIRTIFPERQAQLIGTKTFPPLPIIVIHKPIAASQEAGGWGKARGVGCWKIIFTRYVCESIYTEREGSRSIGSFLTIQVVHAPNNKRSLPKDRTGGEKENDRMHMTRLADIPSGNFSSPPLSPFILLARAHIGSSCQQLTEGSVKAVQKRKGGIRNFFFSMLNAKINRHGMEEMLARRHEKLDSLLRFDELSAANENSWKLRGYRSGGGGSSGSVKKIQGQLMVSLNLLTARRRREDVSDIS